MEKFEALKKLIKKQNWALDCCGKQDLDMPLIYISTRYYPDHTAYASFEYGDYEDPFDSLLESGEIKGDSEEECKLKVRQWYVDNLEKAFKLLEEKQELEQI